MKYSFVLAALLICTKPVFAQSYTSIFGDSATSWSVVSGYCDAICTDNIHTGRDTLIANADNDKFNYKVITGNPWFIGTDFYHLREDTLQGKVWLYDARDSTEYLIMDLGLQLGDTFIFEGRHVQQLAIVDSVYLTNGLKHIRLQAYIDLCGMGEPITFIEGSGPNASVVFPEMFYGYAPSFMLCHYKDGGMIRGNELFHNECYICIIGLEENNLNNQVRLFPVPASDVLHIATDVPFGPDAVVTLYNAHGRVMLSESLANSGMELHVAELDPGVYLVHISDKKQGSFQRFVKE